MSERSLPAIVNDLYTLLEPCTPEDRSKAIKAVLTLLGDEPPYAQPGSGPVARSNEPNAVDTPKLGPKAARWVQQHGLERHLASVFYFHQGKVDVHVDTMVGKSKREQTVNCYLIEGVRAYLETDNMQFADASAIKLAKHTQCYDKNNHTANRKVLGNKVTGSKETPELSGPGLKAAAAIVVELANSVAGSSE